jgi:hypothetical protein
LGQATLEEVAMASKKSEDRHIEKSLEIGRKNADLMPKVRRWCKHLDIKMTSAGILAEVYRLPVGSMRVTCPHGTSLVESMHLSGVARSFILENCAGCPHHEEISPDNFGREVFDEKAKADAQKEQDREQREELKQRLYQEAQQALDTRDTPRRSINSLVLAFQDSEPNTPEYRDIIDQLIQAAKVAPEHFSDEALRVLVTGDEETHLAAGLRVSRPICAFRKRVPDFVLQAATKTVGRPFDMGGDAACGILLEHALINDLSDVLPLLQSIISVANYRLAHFLMSPIIRSEPSFPNTLELLRLVFAQKPEEARKAFDERLRRDSKETKLNAAKTLQAMLPDLVEEVLPLTRVLLYSLELEDDHYEESADHEVCELISHLYAYSPQFVEDKIEAFRPVASDEVKTLLTHVYSLIVRHASTEHRWSKPVFAEELYVRQVPVAIDYLFNAMADVRLDVEERAEICDELEDAVKAFPEAAFARLDRVLGRLAMTIREAEQIPKDGADYLEYMANDTRRIQFDRLIGHIVKITRTLVRHAPQKAFPVITQTTRDLSSKNDTRLKAELVGTLRDFAKDDNLLPQVIPELYRHLTDYESNLVRSRAINVLSDLLDHSPGSVPSNMLELLLIYLQDPYVIIHKSAVRALAHTKLKRDDFGWDALNRVLALERAYADDANQTAFWEDIIQTLYAAFRAWPEVDRYIATKLLPKYSRHSEKYFAEDMLVRLSRLVENYPEVAAEFIEIAVEYVRATSAKRTSNGDLYSDRSLIWQGLFKAPQELLKTFVRILHEAALQKIQHDPLTSYQIIELLSHAGLKSETLALANDLLASLPDVKSNKYRRDTCHLIAAAEHAEQLCAAGETEKAMQVLDEADKAVPIESKLHEKLEAMWRAGLIETL